MIFDELKVQRYHNFVVDEVSRLRLACVTCPGLLRMRTMTKQIDATHLRSRS